MNKYTNPKACGLPTAAELRDSLIASESSETREQIALLFDEGSFVETSAYMTRSISDYLSSDKANELEGVITGYGAIDGKLTFLFAEDSSRMGGVIDERHAKKIVDLYKLAISNGAPVIGIFNSNGTDIFAGTTGLASYGRIIAAVNSASGKIPQIAFIGGKCIGTAATIASMFDFVVKSNSAELYVSSPALTGAQDAQNDIISYSEETVACAGFIRSLVSFLPDNSSVGVELLNPTDNLNRMLGDIDFAGEGLSAISVLADNGMFYEIGHADASPAVCAFTVIGGVKCGVVANSYANNEGRLCSRSARKIARFVNFCDSFKIPVVTLVDSMGLAIDKNNEDTFAPELAKLAFAYASSNCPKVTVIIGHAIGASFILLGSKALGADLVYALDDSEIGALSAESGVAFAWDKYINEQTTRASLIEDWKTSVSSASAAAAGGEIDDIISVNELRARICSALLMLCAKGFANNNAHKVLPL